MDKYEDVAELLQQYNDTMEKAKIRQEGAEEGLAIGLKEGRQQGLQLGMYRALRAVFTRLVKKGMKPNEISKLLGYSEAEILKVLDKNPDGSDRPFAETLPKKRKRGSTEPVKRCFYVDLPEDK
ncbi:hypothetical protein Ami103574_02000 [Aminipila butyrica]|uniref:Essential protein Yae1 N-terminal domain-containing protein n=1 Tax=Aminipila butyrica TaxID=433296 RepID=A0A858BSR9_9FIRM|nr:hypothetical protein [Aminipila butyrica]QIB68155.1 hypothetical protein Ami103574_02000 [Aminipila butyrica]